MFNVGLEVPPNWVVVPYGPTASLVKLSVVQMTSCACVGAVKPLNRAIKDKRKSGFLIWIGFVTGWRICEAILRVVFRIAYE
jgi:hypothetical protein